MNYCAEKKKKELKGTWLQNTLFIQLVILDRIFIKFMRSGDLHLIIMLSVYKHSTSWYQLDPHWTDFVAFSFISSSDWIKAGKGDSHWFNKLLNPNFCRATNTVTRLPGWIRLYMAAWGHGSGKRGLGEDSECSSSAYSFINRPKYLRISQTVREERLEKTDFFGKEILELQAGELPYTFCVGETKKLSISWC